MKTRTGIAALICIFAISPAISAENPAPSTISAALTARSAPGAGEPASARSDGVVRQKARSALSAQPMAFVANGGQVEPNVRYHARGNGYAFFFVADEVAMVFTKPVKAPEIGPNPASAGHAGPSLPESEQRTKGIALALRFVDANPDASLTARRPSHSTANYFIGNDPSRWRAGLSTYREVIYRELWPGVDAVFRGDNAALKSNFVVRPGNNIRSIRLAYAGATGISVDHAGNLIVETARGPLVEKTPISYQTVDGEKRVVPTRYVVSHDAEGRAVYGFKVGREYDPRQPLVIDPSLEYSSYLGAQGDDGGNSVAVDGTGAVYITGYTYSTSFPTTLGAFDTTHNGSYDAFVAKLDLSAAGADQLVASTYLGGNSSDYGYAIAVDGAGNAYLTGYTYSANFPTTTGAFDTTHNGSYDTFVVKLGFGAPGSVQLIASTFIGGRYTDFGVGIAVDGSGNAYVAGSTYSPDFPTTTGAFNRTQSGSYDVFVVKLDLDATGPAQLAASTFLGGTGTDNAYGIAVDGAGDAYVTGYTYSANFPITPGAFGATPNGSYDAFVAKLDLAANGPAQLIASTYLGGSGADYAYGIAVDSAGNAYVTGSTYSLNFPTTTGAFDGTPNGGADVFVAELDLGATGSDQLIASTYLGGSNADTGQDIAVDGAGAVHVVGYTTSATFPTTSDAFDTTHNGGYDAFVARLDLRGTGPAQLLASSFLGGGSRDYARGVAVRGGGDAVVTGSTQSPDFPTTPGAVAGTPRGRYDAFVAVMRYNTPPVADAGGPYAVGEGSTITVQATGSDADGDALTYAWDLDNDGTFETSGQTATFDASEIDGPATRTVGVQVTDARGASTIATATVSIDNMAPAVTSITAPADPIAIETDIVANATFADAGTGDTHTGVWDWGDGTTSAATISDSAGSGSATGTHRYTAPGAYTVTLTVTDDDGGQGTNAFQFVYVYDAHGGFVTGRGTIESPLGAYAADASMSGLAIFGFTAKYVAGGTAPTGNTDFQLHVAGLNFRSDNCQWMAITGERARIEGTGTLNGADGYSFMLTAIDSDVSGSGGPDMFRIRIWNQDGVVYDNQMGETIDSGPSNAIRRGSIVVHDDANKAAI